MTDELKPCPFCGSMPIPNKSSHDPTRVSCSKPGCYNYEEWRVYGFSVKTWNTLPIEDALRAELRRRNPTMGLERMTA